MKRKQGRNEPCDCGSGLKYKKCCGASSGAPAAAAELPQSTADDLRDSRYLLQLDGEEFVREFRSRLRSFLGSDIELPALDSHVAGGDQYDGAIRVIPMMHRPTAGWDGVPADIVEFVRASQTELIECLEDLAGREDIVIVAEGFRGELNAESFIAAVKTDPALRQKMDGYGVAEFVCRNPHVPVFGGDIPSSLHDLNERILHASTSLPKAGPVFNAMQELRNRYAVQVALRAADSTHRTPTLVFGLHHVEGIMYAAKKLTPDVKVTLIPTVAPQWAQLFMPGAVAEQ